MSAPTPDRGQADIRWPKQICEEVKECEKFRLEPEGIIFENSVEREILPRQARHKSRPRWATLASTTHFNSFTTFLSTSQVHTAYCSTIGLCPVVYSPACPIAVSFIPSMHIPIVSTVVREVTRAVVTVVTIPAKLFGGRRRRRVHAY